MILLACADSDCSSDCLHRPPHQATLSNVAGRCRFGAWHHPDSYTTFWEVIAFLANAIIFLMVGLEISNINFADKWPEIGGSILIVLAARFIAVYASLTMDRSGPSGMEADYRLGRPEMAPYRSL